jgi:2-polyprenyl-6-methoxyphenol hydroxylase-like FAD-dependent oxidoreductase
MDILIAGGGIAGLAFARAAARCGLAPEVIEREPAWRAAGTGLYLPGNATRALRELGIDAPGYEIARQCFRDHRGRLLCDVDVARLWRHVGPCLGLRRADLHALLADGVPVRLGLSVERIAQRAGGVAVTFSDGTARDYDLVVGADGIHSAVRRLAFGPELLPRPVGQTGRRFLARRPPEVTTWSVMLGRGAAFLTVPLGDQVYCYCDGDTDFAEPAATLLQAAREVHAGPIEEVALDRWVQGHVVLIGDAAHATSPNMAQGAAMALEDALVLAECLRDRAPIPGALAAFEARRRPRTDWVRAQTHRRDRTRSLPAAVRDPVLRRRGQRMLYASYRPLLAAP